MFLIYEGGFRLVILVLDEAHHFLRAKLASCGIDGGVQEAQGASPPGHGHACLIYFVDFFHP